MMLLQLQYPQADRNKETLETFPLPVAQLHIMYQGKPKRSSNFASGKGKVDFCISSAARGAVTHGLRNEMHIWLKRLRTKFRRCASFCLGTMSKRLEASKRYG